MRNEQHEDDAPIVPARGSGSPRQRVRPREGQRDVSTREAAAILGRSERSVQRAVARGEIAAARVGSGYRIARDELERVASTTALPWAEPSLPTIVALPVLAERMASLPAPLSSLIGRDQDVTEVVAVLADPAVRLVTLTGPGGIGKTRLAMAAAAVVEEHFADGVAFVALETVRRPEHVVPVIAQALGLRERADQSPTEQLRVFLRDRHCLLVLDNFEQILDAGSDIAALLSGARNVKALVTSRAPLRIGGEREVQISPLTLAGDRATQADLLRSGAGRLFIERARDHAPSFTLDERTAPVVAAICAQLEGLPLAIELATARLRVLPLHQVHARLEHRLPLLTLGTRDAPDRHSTMRDAIAWSYELLSDDEQILFRRLAVFAGGFTLEAAEEVGGKGGAQRPPLSPFPPSSALDMMTALIDQSLVIAEAGPDGEPRFRLLETIREYGLEQLSEAGEEAVARARHARYFLTLAQSLQPIVSTHGRQSTLDDLAAEHANLQAALTWLEEQGPVQDFVALVAALSDYWFAQNLFREGLGWLERGQARLEAVSTLDQARILAGKGGLLLCQGRVSEAEPFLAQALALVPDAGEPIDMGWTLILRGAALNASDSFAEAELPLQAALKLTPQIGDPVMRAAVAGRALANLSLAARGQGDVVRAAMYCEEALRLYEGQQLDRAASISLMDLGAIAYTAGDYALAATRWQEGIALHGTSGDLRQIADALSGLACVASAWEQERTALLLFGAADAVRERAGTTMLWSSDVAAVEECLTRLCHTFGQQRVSTMRLKGQKLSLAEAAAMAATIAPPADRPSGGLTRREVDVLRLLAEHKSDREIADALFLSLRTVNWHVRSIMSKLDASSRKDAVARARLDELI